MPAVSIPPSPTLTADDEQAKRREPSAMLELYLGQEPTVMEKLLAGGKQDAKRNRVDAAKNEIRSFERKRSQRP